MPYPPVLYDGDGGEVSATIRRSDTPPEVVYPNGNTVGYLATGHGTHGLFGLYRWEFAGPRSGPDPHYHRTLTESFYVLEGQVSIHDGVDWRVCGPGDYAHVPPGGVHGFKNDDGPAAMLLHFAPGAPREAYFEGLARGIDALAPDELAEFMREHDNLWV